MGKHTNFWDMTEEERLEWIAKNPILKIPIKMNDEAEENENRNQENL
jgi:hypothetical protein